MLNFFPFKSRLFLKGVHYMGKQIVHCKSQKLFPIVKMVEKHRVVSIHRKFS